MPPIEEYLGEEISSRIERVLGGRKPVVFGRFTQALPNNWKLYMENVKDSYHASILHLFFTTFELNRLSQKGGIIVDDSGGHHVSFSAIDTLSAERMPNMPSSIFARKASIKLADPSLLQGFKEYPDNVTLQILSVFPTFVLQQIQNAIAVRQIVPRGIDRDRSELDLSRLCRRYAGAAPDPPQAGQSGRAGRLHLDGGRLRRRLRPARHRRRVASEEAVIEMGGSRHREQRKPGHRGFGARLLEGLSHANGPVREHAMTDSVSSD